MFYFQFGIVWNILKYQHNDLKFDLRLKTSIGNTREWHTLHVSRLQIEFANQTFLAFRARSAHELGLHCSLYFAIIIACGWVLGLVVDSESSLHDAPAISLRQY